MSLVIPYENVPKPIVNIMQIIVDKVSAEMLTYIQGIEPTYTGVHYDYGKLNEINAKLQRKNNNDNRFDKFPLIGLFIDVLEDKSNLQIGISSRVGLRMFIGVKTELTFTNQQRTQNKFIPLLHQLYYSLLSQIAKSGFFLETDWRKINHKKVDCYSTGKETDKHLFSDYMDIVEITDLELHILQKANDC